MTLRKKMTIIIIAITFAFTFFSSIIFINFFSNYLGNQEDAQINTLSSSVKAFLDEKSSKIQGNVNDYAHWDDTNDFINNYKAQEYIDANLIESTFINVDVNFIIYIREDNSIKYSQYYDNVNNKFTQFPEKLDENMIKIIRDSNPQKKIPSIMKSGGQFYFIAVASITDSKGVKKPNGKMLMGKLIDENIIKTLKEMTGSDVSFSTISNDGVDESNSLHPIKINKEKDTMQVEFILPNTAFEGSSVLITLKKDRTLFLGGMNRIKSFILIYSTITILILFIIFALLGRYITRPFNKLIDEVKGLDLTKDEIQKLEVHGNDEFTFLRNSVNNMLSRIGIEQYKVRETKEKLSATLTSVGDGVIAIDRRGLVDFMNPTAQRLTGWHQEEFHGKPFDTVFEIINEYTRERVESSVYKVFETEETIQLANHTILISKDGSERSIEDTAAPIKDTFGKVIGVVLVFRDFSEKKEKLRQIEFLSYHDQLTGLYNRRFFEEELKRLDIRRNLPLSFVFADVNGLKTINDAFGHQYGDMLIQQVSEAFKEVCRADDIISRTGGDEFVILLPKTEAVFVQELVKRLKEKIEQRQIMNISISVAFGWDTKDMENTSALDVLKNAEDLMYQKKIFDNSSKRSAVIKSIFNMLCLKSSREGAHSKRVSTICKDIGKAYDLSDDDVEELSNAGKLHDIGKIAVDGVILNKLGKLSENEWVQVKHHPETGYRLLGTSSEYYNIAEYVLAHHERLDGMGYPKGLKGEAIHWKARIIALADAYDAMTCDRPYRKALSVEAAVEEIKKNAGTQFDPDIARVFVEKVLGVMW